MRPALGPASVPADRDAVREDVRQALLAIASLGFRHALLAPQRGPEGRPPKHVRPALWYVPLRSDPVAGIRTLFAGLRHELESGFPTGNAP